MPLILTETQEVDAPRIAEIHMAAFHDNAMLLAQFPTSVVRAELFNTLVQKARDEVRDPQWTVLVVRDEPEFQPQQQTKTEDSSEVGQDPVRVVCPIFVSLDLSYIATDPEHERRGAASMLVKWGIEQAKKGGVLVALESTKQGWPSYERLGFKAEGLITMVLEATREAGAEGALRDVFCLETLGNLSIQ
ncbi:hypothetical protein BDV41DRAFT_577443 [Aspergillus transmontanensis]|uniref:N-acetyltransferase domain-containing protein n=1 Tax=Aspergillus transmontanensis TaxID=1034304 RepID=A0A5N6VVW1_9EURO|nr:hypothetical protein BDV41DRAFT_577443 [Aspergillus transmontanensis]